MVNSVYGIPVGCNRTFKQLPANRNAIYVTVIAICSTTETIYHGEVAHSNEN